MIFCWLESRLPHLATSAKGISSILKATILKHLVTPCCVDLATCQGEDLSVTFSFRERNWGRRAGTTPVLTLTKPALVDCAKASNWHTDRQNCTAKNHSYITVVQSKKSYGQLSAVRILAVILVPFPLAYIPNSQTSLVAQWLRIRLPMQGTRVQALVREDPTCRGATKPVRHNYWAHAPQLLKPTCLEHVLCNKRSHRNEKPTRPNEE